MPEHVPEFVVQYCADCHDDIEKEADLDLWTLSSKPMDPDDLETWIKAFDRAAAGEMPPEEKKRRPKPADLDAFLGSLAQVITNVEHQAIAEKGRAVKRRLNRYEYENSLRDLLSLPELSIRDSLPEDSTAHGYNKLGEALAVSHVQIARYLSAAEFALRQAIAPQAEMPERTFERHYTWQNKQFHRTIGPQLRYSYPIVGHELQVELAARRDPETKELIRPDVIAASRPERAEQEAIVLLMSTYEAYEIKFNEFRAPAAGNYRLRFSGYTVRMASDYLSVSKGRRSEPVTIYAQTPPRHLRRLGSFDFGVEPTVNEIDVWLETGETIQVDATRLVRSRPPDFKNPLQDDEGMPGVAFQWMEVDGPIYESWPPAGHELLFGDLPLQEVEAGDADGNARRARVKPPESPAEEAEKLLLRFMQQAYRRPLADVEASPFLELIHEALDNQYSFEDALIAGYTAVLASPGFLYLDSKPGRLDDYALAERLSYFLWNSPPDERLRELASSGELLNERTLGEQVERMLDDPRSRRFVDAFLDYWLDLRYISGNGPDAELYPEYQIDDNLTESMPVETQLYFTELLRENHGVRKIVDSDFIIVNERLGTLYDLPNVRGSEFRKVALPPGSPRGGLMTQASALKVTNAGTTTSPVTRGVWIMERILGYHPSPPPPDVGAVESDIRGATTVREQLALHTSEQSCNSCHSKIDPAGFALESFDVMGAFREYYRSTGNGEGRLVPGVGHHGQRFRYRLAQPVDASGQLPDGRPFSDIRGLKRLLLEDEETLARNFARQLAIYATGAKIHFSDRAAIDSILEATRASGYGVRDIIHELVKSELLLNK